MGAQCVATVQNHAMQDSYVKKGILKRWVLRFDLKVGKTDVFGRDCFEFGIKDGIQYFFHHHYMLVCQFVGSMVICVPSHRTTQTLPMAVTSTTS